MSLLAKYGRVLGPKAYRAIALAGPLLDKNPRIRDFMGDAADHLKKLRRGSRLTAQIELARTFATEALTEQSVPERQELARVWLQRANAGDMAIRASENVPRRAAKRRRQGVAEQVDSLLAEIVETASKWAES